MAQISGVGKIGTGFDQNILAILRTSTSLHISFGRLWRAKHRTTSHNERLANTNFVLNRS